MITFTLAGGCYWCLDAVFTNIRGVEKVISGFTGGKTKNPSYEQVCSGQTGHAEAVQVFFNEKIIPQNILLDIFFTLHNPTSLNRQGNDIGTQYRSAMFYVDQRQKILFNHAIERAKALWGDNVVTELEPLGEFYEGPDYHQDFFASNPSNSYCQIVINPKINKVKQKYSEWLK